MRWKKEKRLLALVLAGVLIFSSLTTYAEQNLVSVSIEQMSQRQEANQKTEKKHQEIPPLEVEEAQ